MDTPGALEQALTEMSHEELLDLVLKVAKEKADFCRALLANVSLAPQWRNSQQVRLLVRQIAVVFEAIKERYGYFEREYDEDERYPELDPIIEAAKVLHPLDQIEVFWHLITCGKRMFEEEEFLMGTQQIEEAISLYAEAAVQIARSPLDKLPYFDALVEALSWQLCAYGEISDAIEGAIASLCTSSADYRYPIAKLQTSSYSRSRELLANFYLKIGDDENYLRIRESNLTTEDHYLEFAEYWRSKGNKEKYIETLEAGVSHLLKKARRPNFSLEFLSLGTSLKSSKLLESLADLYELKGDWDNFCRLLMAKGEYSGVTLELYQQIKDISAPLLDKWQTLEPKLLELAQRNPETLAEIYLWEDNWSAAVNLARQQPHAERLQVLIAEGVKERHPQEALKIYEKLVQHYIDLKSRDGYRTAARHADAIKSIYLSILNDADTWRQYIEALRQRYPRYRALQEEFRRL